MAYIEHRAAANVIIFPHLKLISRINVLALEQLGLAL
jgi:hypothetical protein